ncbi:MAG: hypothetical protein ACYDC5_04110 [Candidatus Dormibacteria bacterium]
MLVVVAALMACGIAVAAYSSYRGDQRLRLDLAQLQTQTTALGGQVQAQQQEVGYSTSPAWQAELARAQGLALAGEQTYAIESAAAAAGPGPAEQGVQKVGSVVETMARAAVAMG